jgi:hypothetical protein
MTPLSYVSSERGKRKEEGGGWRVESGEWRVEGGGWRVEGGGWRGEREEGRKEAEAHIHPITSRKRIMANNLMTHPD